MSSYFLCPRCKQGPLFRFPRYNGVGEHAICVICGAYWEKEMNPEFNEKDRPKHEGPPTAWEKRMSKNHHILSDKKCECGCGQFVKIAYRNCPRLGWKKGQPLRFITGHNQRVANQGEKQC